MMRIYEFRSVLKRGEIITEVREFIFAHLSPGLEIPDFPILIFLLRIVSAFSAAIYRITDIAIDMNPGTLPLFPTVYHIEAIMQQKRISLHAT